MSRNKLRVGIVGVGNCASSFVQGVSFYREASANEPPPGLMNLELGGYQVGDIELASAFDIHAGKVGRDLSEAILAPPNNTLVFARPAPSGVPVQRGPTFDGIGQYMADEIAEAAVPPVDVAEARRGKGTEKQVTKQQVGTHRPTA
jgi:myo-inositol-1-phosphate synthase